MRTRRIVLTLLSALLFPLALPSELFAFGNPFIGIWALSFFYLALLSAESTREAVVHGVLFGSVSTAIANYWLMYFGQFSAWTLGGVIAGYTGYNALLAPILWYYLRASSRWRPFLFAAAWTGYEYLKSVGFLAYPWGLSAYPFNTLLHLTQMVDVTGIWGLCFLASLANALVAEGLQHAFLRLPVPGGRRAPGLPMGLLRSSISVIAQARLLGAQALMFALLLVAALLYGVVKLREPIPVVGRFDAVLVQQNSDSWIQGNDVETLRTAEELTDQGIRMLGHRPDVVVWSETSLRYPFTQGQSFYQANPPDRPFIPFLRGLGTYLVTGSPYIVDTRWDAMNAVILLNPQAKMTDFYGKQHLVPFAESFPFWDIPIVRSFVQNAIGLEAIWVPGRKYTVFRIPLKSGGELRFGTPICFEDAFGYLCRNFVRHGAEVLINLTNNSWSNTDSAQTQHFVAARFRSIENRVTLVRSTNSGLTSVVDAYGRITARLPMFRKDVLPVTVPIYKPATPTIYTRFGDWLPVALLLLLLGVLIADRIAERRARDGFY
ncbi:apolipoprotein N-acyltransferase [Salinispira pacifica]